MGFALRGQVSTNLVLSTGITDTGLKRSSLLFDNIKLSGTVSRFGIR